MSRAACPSFMWKRRDLVQAERAQHAHAADAEHDLLAQAVVLVAAVEVVGERRSGLGVLRQVGVEQQDRHVVAADAAHLVVPRAHAAPARPSMPR